MINTMANSLDFLLTLTDKVSAPLKKITRLVQKLEVEEEQLTATTTNMGSAFAGWGFQLLELANRGLETLIGGTIEATGRFERFGAVLSNTLGAEQARKALEDINTFAATTPFQVDELTDSYLKLANRGLTPTLEQMTLLGDLAASQGKSFEQLTEAVLDATTGEFERLKEFGIKASKEGDRVTIAFKGMQQTIANTPEAIQQALLGFGELEGVAGGMAAISNTLEGQLSNLQDRFTKLQVTLGTAFRKSIGSGIGVINALLNKLESLADWLLVNQGLVSDVFIAFGIAAGVAGLALIALNAKVLLLNANLLITALLDPFRLMVISAALLAAGVVLLWQRFETFRGVLLGLWEVGKFVFSRMMKISELIWEQIIIGVKAVQMAFTAFKAWFSSLVDDIFEIIRPLVDFFARIFKNVSNALAESLGLNEVSEGINRITGDLKDLFGVNEIQTRFSAGFQEGVNQVSEKTANERDERGLFERLVPDLGVNPLSASGGNDGSPANLTGEVSGATNNINQGGRQPRQTNITVNIGSQIGNVEITSAQEDLEELGDRVLEQLSRAINGALATI